MSYASRKQHNERNQQILKALLKEEPNRFCADCKTSKNPRWASWNLGIFICIRCSGIHRSMGTHISRVKSVDLDSWTDEQVKSMVKWGNAKANGFWESGLPDNYVPNESKIENFVRTKYDLKKWAASSTVPDPSTVHGKTTNLDAGSSSSNSNQRVVSSGSRTRDSPLPAPKSRHGSTSGPPRSSHNTMSNSNSLLDLDFGSPSTSTSTSSESQQKPQLKKRTSHSTIKHGSTSSASSSSSPALPRQSSNLSTLSFLDSNSSSSLNTNSTQQQQQSSQKPVNNADLKKSILSLYSTPTSSNQSLPNTNNSLPQSNGYGYGYSSNSGSRSGTPGAYNNFGTNGSAAAANGLSSGLAGLNLGSNSTSISNVNGNGWGNSTATATAGGAGSNPWSSSSTAVSSSASTKKKYEEDVFRNVWN
ncbi:unnamed protein product [Ambrosiozyma monospora]|uniref:Unnamed protein product n=1 Tax=Ambrosiozyma monospora TaxID=43982 RepID=A0A9W6YTN8_AMBMO|nr:unnamed protein product [Ambrosiozyma monospora]